MILSVILWSACFVGLPSHQLIIVLDINIVRVAIVSSQLY